MKATKVSRPFYGWVIVFACMLLAAASTGLMSYFGALFVTPVSETLGIARASLAVYSTIYTVVSMLLLPFVGILFKKASLKLLLVIGCILGAGAQFCYSFSNNVYGFYIGAILGGIGNCLFGSIPIAILISNWFVEKKGVATGLAFAGTGLVTSLLSPGISNIIASVGWRWGYRVIGITVLIVTLFATVCLIKVSPAEVGQAALGTDNGQDRQDKAGFSRKQAITMPVFWTFAVAIFLIGAATMGTQQQLVSYWVDMGNTSAFAAKMYSLMMFTAIFAKIILGGIYDKAGVKLSAIISCCIAAIALLTLRIFPRGNVVAIPAILFGVAASIQVLVPTVVTNILFGDRDYSSIFGLVSTILYCGVAVGGLFSAWIFDNTGGYQLAWLVFAILFIIALLALIKADKLSQRAFREVLGIERGMQGKKIKKAEEKTG